MERLHNGFTLELAPGAFPLSTDSVALADFVKLPAKARVLDLCSGCGTLGLMLCAKDQDCQVTGIEISGSDHEAADRNSRRNGIESRLTSICGDITQAAQLIKPGAFHICVSNPPYFSGGPKSAANPSARRDDLCPPQALFAAAGRALKWGGDFYLVHRPEMLAHLCAIGAAAAMEAKELLLLRHRSDGPVSLILLKFRKGGKPGLQITERSLHHPDGTPTDYYRTIYHLGE